MGIEPRLLVDTSKRWTPTTVPTAPTPEGHGSRNAQKDKKLFHHPPRKNILLYRFLEGRVTTFARRPNVASSTDQVLHALDDLRAARSRGRVRVEHPADEVAEAARVVAPAMPSAAREGELSVENGKLQHSLPAKGKIKLHQK